MIEIFNRLQKIFGRPITLVGIDHETLYVRCDWWGETFEIWLNGHVWDYETGDKTNNSKWIEKILEGAKRNDAGELVQPCES